MAVELTSDELSLIIESLSDSIDTHEAILKDLTAPDERYERNDVQNKLLRLTALRCLMQQQKPPMAEGGKLCHA